MEMLDQHKANMRKAFKFLMDNPFDSALRIHVKGQLDHLKELTDKLSDCGRD